MPYSNVWHFLFYNLCLSFQNLTIKLCYNNQRTLWLREKLQPTIE